MPRQPAVYKWQVVGMLWLVCFFNYADRQAMYAIFPQLQSEFGFDKAQLGLIGSAFMWVYAAGAPFAGFICDRVRRKDLILGGCVFWSGVTVLTGFCGRLWQFVAVRALEGGGETFYYPASMSLTSDYHDPRTRSRAFAFHQSSVYIGTILGSWIGALCAEVYGWRLGFWLFGGAGVVLALTLYRFLHEPERPTGTTAEPLPWRETCRSIFRTPAATLLMLAFVAANFVATIFLTWTPTFLVEKFHFKLGVAGLSGTVFIHLASALAVPVAGVWSDRLAARGRSNGRMLVQGAGLLVGAPFVFIVGRTADVATLLVAMTVFGVCKGFYDAGIFASLFDVIEPRARGSAAGLMNAVGWTGGALGPVFVGLATKHGAFPTETENMSHAIAFGGVVYVMGAALIALAATRKRRL